MAAQVPPPQPTNAQRARRFLLYGFIISIALHILIGPYLQIRQQPPEPEKVSVIKRDRIPTPPPTPKPTPKPTPTPPPTPPPKETPPPHTPEPEKPKIKINSAKTNSNKGLSSEAANSHTTGSVNGVPQGTSTSAAAVAPTVSTAPPAPPPPPTPTPKTCPVPNAPPHVVSAAQVDTPEMAQRQGISGEVSVLIDLDVNSKMVSAPVIQKSPSIVLNKAAIEAARESKFQTEVKDCTPLASKYIFVVEFQSQ